MAYILCIETSGDTCSVAIGLNQHMIASREWHEKNAHARLLTTLVDEAMHDTGIVPAQLAAIAVSQGPGSYTGLRVGVSTAKGYAYALNIPLIAIPTLLAVAHGFKQQNPDTHTWVCPMLDARRMEVYTTLYDANLLEQAPTQALILDEHMWENYRQQPIAFLGSGAPKMNAFLPLFPHGQLLPAFHPLASHLVPLAFKAFDDQRFVDVAYVEPFYLKDFVGTTPKKPIRGQEK